MIVQRADLSTPVRHTKARREAKRASIMAGARKCFQELGYDVATVEDLLEYAGISRRTFYSYFTSKSSILIAIVESVEPELMELYGDLGALTDVSQSHMESWLRKLLGFFSAHPDVLEIWSSAMHDRDFLLFLRGLANRMAQTMGLQPVELAGKVGRATMFTTLFLSQIGQFCSIVALSVWSNQQGQATALMAEILHRSFIAMAQADGTLTEEVGHPPKAIADASERSQALTEKRHPS